MTLDPSFMSTFILIATAFSAAFGAALWLSLIFWAYRDIKKRSRDPLLRILAVLVVAVLFLPGILIYLILRPPQTIEAEYQNSLEEEALLQSIEDAQLCPDCGRKVETGWMACPNCHTRLKKVCHHCNKLMDLAWNLCPYCATPAPGMRKENLTFEDSLQPIPSSQDED